MVSLNYCARAFQRMVRHHRGIGLAAVVLFLGTVVCNGQNRAPSAGQVLDRAVEDFASLRIGESLRGFDEVIRLAPAQAPQLWQRGIALYYAGRWEDCRAQFELHRGVNPNDVENAVWHYLCVARAASPDVARAELLPVGPDSRVPMAEIYQMFSGSLDPPAVLAAARTPLSEFYAHLYVGLFYEAQGEVALAREQILAAASDEYRAAGGYMHMVARVHQALKFGG